MLAEALDYFGIADAIENHLVDLIADGFWETSDFSIAAVLEVKEGICGGFGVGGLVWQSEDFGFVIHKESCWRFWAVKK